MLLSPCALSLSTFRKRRLFVPAFGTEGFSDPLFDPNKPCFGMEDWISPHHKWEELALSPLMRHLHLLPSDVERKSWHLHSLLSQLWPQILSKGKTRRCTLAVMTVDLVWMCMVRFRLYILWLKAGKAFLFRSYVTFFLSLFDLIQN